MMKGVKSFKDRKDAGMELGTFLALKYKRLSNPLVIGIPRGGVEVAYYVAQKLRAELSLIISKKLPFPGQPEYGFGAVSEENAVYVSAERRGSLLDSEVNEIIERQKKEVKARILTYRGGSPLPDMTNRIIILVDDGIATGVTLVPVIQLCRAKGAAKIIVAAPVAGITFDEHLREADEIEVLVQPLDFYAVGQVYDEFGDVEAEELMDLLAKAKEWKH